VWAGKLSKLWDSLSELRSSLCERRLERTVEACAIACQNCAIYSVFPSGMASHSKIAQFNWECIGRFSYTPPSCTLFTNEVTHTHTHTNGHTFSCLKFTSQDGSNIPTDNATRDKFSLRSRVTIKFMDTLEGRGAHGNFYFTET